MSGNNGRAIFRLRRDRFRANPFGVAREKEKNTRKKKARNRESRANPSFHGFSTRNEVTRKCFRSSDSTQERKRETERERLRGEGKGENGESAKRESKAVIEGSVNGNIVRAQWREGYIPRAHPTLYLFSGARLRVRRVHARGFPDFRRISPQIFSWRVASLPFPPPLPPQTDLHNILEILYKISLSPLRPAGLARADALLLARRSLLPTERQMGERARVS